jgi:hypothetical protein
LLLGLGRRSGTKRKSGAREFRRTGPTGSEGFRSLSLPSTPTSHFRRRSVRDGFLSPSTNEGNACMFTRIVELSTKPGENRELSDSINDKVVPILKKQKSFVDETVLVSDTEANRIPQLLENQ